MQRAKKKKELTDPDLTAVECRISFLLSHFKRISCTSQRSRPEGICLEANDKGCQLCNLRHKFCFDLASEKIQAQGARPHLHKQAFDLISKWLNPWTAMRPSSCSLSVLRTRPRAAIWILCSEVCSWHKQSDLIPLIEMQAFRHDRVLHMKAARSA